MRGAKLFAAGAVLSAVFFWALPLAGQPADFDEESESGPVQLTAKQAEEAQKFYQEGLKHYLRRDYQNASAEWQKALSIDKDNARIKDYLDKSYQKSLESKELFLKGIESFRKADYKSAEQSFQDSLLINPFDERTKRYLQLCVAPNLQMSAKKKIFTPSARDNIFQMSVDKSQSTPDWIRRWEVVILDSKRQVVRSITGEGEVPTEVAWDVKDAKGVLYTGEKARYALRLTSIYNRLVSTLTNEVVIDALGPVVSVKANDSFTPDDVKGKAVNKVTFNLTVKDVPSGVGTVKIDIFKDDAKTLVASLPAQASGSVVWDGTKSDGSKVQGGDTVFYSVVAQDNAGNISRTEPAKIAAEIYIDETFRMNLPNIEFAFGKADLMPASHNILNQVGNILGRFPRAKFVIEGHTDDVGSAERNMALSRQRAQSVYAYLKRNFKLTDDRVELRGLGPTKPVAPNDTDDNRRKNRRVEIQIINE